MSDHIKVNIFRGDIVESSHLVTAIMLDKDGNTLKEWGDISRLINPRSTIKPIQALSFVHSGAAEAYGISNPEIALACSSHDGEAIHTDLVKSWLPKIGLEISDLQCGTHAPKVKSVVNEMIKKDIPFDATCNNCSGKHMGMLTTCRHRSWDTEDYLNPDHPLQTEIFDRISDLAEYDVRQVKAGTDGCSAPTPAIPIKNMALAFANYTNTEKHPSELAASIERILSAIQEHPFLVSGTQQFDSILMHAAKGKVFSKKGAEGNHWLYIPDQKKTVYLKVEDGDTPERRAEFATAGALLQMMEAIDAETAKTIQPFTNPTLRNWKGLPIGHIEVLL